MQTSLKTTWEGTYFDGRTATRHAATITVMGSGLHVALENGSSLWWTYDQLRQTQGFHPGEQVRLELGGELPEALVVSNLEFLTAIRQVAPQAPGRFSSPARRSVRLPVALLAGAAAILLGAALYLWGIPAVSDWAASRVPVPWEEQLGREVIEQLAPSERRCADPRTAQALDQILSSLTASGPPSPYRFTVTVVDQSSVNAFAAPGGTIVVYRGLLKKTGTPEELAGVLAHEIEHVVHRHGVKAVFREMSMRTLVSFLTGDASATLYGLDAAATLGGLRYHRRDEEEADREGMKAIQAARINPAGWIHLFRRLEEEAAASPGVLQYLSTHPPTPDRIKQLERLAAQVRYTPAPLLPDYPWNERDRICSG